MMSMHDNWGTTRERSRKRRRWQWVGLAVVLVVLAPIAASFGLGLVEGIWSVRDPGTTVSTRDHIGYVGVAMTMLVALAVQYRLWRAADEVERGQIATALSLAAIVALTILPVLSLAQGPLGLRNPAMIGWGLAAATLIATRIVQRLRG
ncbi:hypothetical protein ASE78_04540 [Sphingomonas sp. Leaf25]|nr:hypothetical protein ASE78_04540 [Sphingomonas sp. Leaf25]